MKVATVVLVVMVGLAASKRTCPAKDNSHQDWSTGTEIVGECRDLSSKCSACTDLCTWADYTHWMQGNCAQTCGFCNTVPSSSGESSCWVFCQGWSDSDILETVSFTTLNDCRDRCLANSECVGAHTTKYTQLPRYCALAKSGSMKTGDQQKYYFAATRGCMEASSDEGINCYNGWSSCSTYSGWCQSGCPYAQRLMTSMCRETCSFCSESDNDEQSEDDHECTWTTIDGEKAKGQSLNDDPMTLEDAKEYCEEQHDSCAGLSCKGSKKCNAMASISNTKSNSKYKVYQKD